MKFLKTRPHASAATMAGLREVILVLENPLPQVRLYPLVTVRGLNQEVAGYLLEGRWRVRQRDGRWASGTSIFLNHQRSQQTEYFVG
jgi:hypothetical protein